ncbi:MAG: DUF3429 domain-containing protein [Hyphomicrobiaceae bacterium]|nr:DUF3429 domain-containing protein [Hyphomicrobiaceae bacterium]
MHTTHVSPPDNPEATVPAAALWLGWLGVMPFAALPLAGALGIDVPFAGWRWALVVYGAVILSFMGGARWGLAMAEAGRNNSALLARRLAISVTPALWAWATVLVGGATAHSLLALIAGFALLLAYDLVGARDGSAPRWYGVLRLRLTVAVALCLAAGSVL